MEFANYTDIRYYKEQHLMSVMHNHFQLNQFHDEIFQHVIQLALKRVASEIGPPPSSFLFFVMGSAGRFEQSVWSDQDHGIIYQLQDEEVRSYFLRLGLEISNGLYSAGYAYCEGGVMAGNRAWCRALSEWQEVIQNWASDSSWESLRHLLILADGRPLYGEGELISQLKFLIFQEAQSHQLLAKMYQNTMHHKKGLGVLGQFLTETHGVHSGSLNIKETALFPYVNAARLLSIREKRLETSTLERIDHLSFAERDLYKQQFQKLLNYRLAHGDHRDYDSGHFLKVNLLTKDLKKEWKEIIKNGDTFFTKAGKIAEKEIKDGKE
jgi:CBS domain-containing protein